MSERWAPVPGYEELYEVSDHGRVRSLDRRVPHARHGSLLLRGKVLALSPMHERPSVALTRCGKSRQVLVHTLVLCAFIGPRPRKAEGCHNDGDHTNNRLTNLRWDTTSSNVLDQVRHGVHRQSRKTHCPRRHLLESPNLRYRSDGKRDCQACQLARRAGAKAATRGEPFDFLIEADRQYAVLMGRPHGGPPTAEGGAPTAHCLSVPG